MTTNSNVSATQSQATDLNATLNTSISANLTNIGNITGIGSLNITNINSTGSLNISSNNPILNITQLNPNLAPDNLVLSGQILAENSAAGTIIGTLTGSDPDVDSILNYTLVDDAGGRFVVNSTTGVVSVNTGADLNYEVTKSFNITARVTDQGGLSYDKVFSIGLTNVNEAPIALALTGGTIAENSAAGIVVGTVIGTDSDAGSILSYSLIDNAGGKFVINAKTGVITVNRRAVLDFEKTPSLNITARVTDQGGLSYDQLLTVHLVNSNEAPIALNLSGGRVAENSAAGTVVGTLAGIDPDADAILNYSLVDDAAGQFVINATTGVITVNTGVSFDYEKTASFNITARVTDQGGLSYSKKLTIALTNVNEAPTALNLSGNTVAENAAAGILVGTLTAIDPDAGARVTYSLVDNAGGRFSVNYKTGAITVNRRAVLDFEQTPSLNITARVTDQGGLSFDQAFTIKLTNINEAPIALSLSNAIISENSAAGTLIGTLTGLDSDAGSVFKYSLVDDAAGRFAVNATTGALTVNNSAGLDYENAKTFNIKARVTDEGGLSYDKLMTISLANVNEAPTDLVFSGGELADNFAAGTVVGTLKGTDLDAGSVLTYSLADDANGRFLVNTKTGVVYVNKGAAFESDKTPVLNIIARVTDQGGLSVDKTFSINLGHVISGTNADDTLLGTDQTDIITGGRGNDYISSGLGNDIYIYNNGDGDDTIDGNTWYNPSLSTIRFGKDISSTRVTIRYDLTGDITIVIAPSSPNASDGGSIVLRDYGNYLSGSSYYSYGNNRDYQIIFADGTKWSQSDIISQFTHITGTDKNDTLFGSFLNDTITGGRGNDSITSTLGTDVYIYNNGDGNDTISSSYYYPFSGSPPAALGTIQFGKDISSSRVTIQPIWVQSELLYPWLPYSDQFELTGDIKITIAPSFPNALDGGSIVLGGYGNFLSGNKNSNNCDYQIIFADGTKWSQSDIISQITHITGTDKNDTLYGSLSNDTIIGGRGNDYITSTVGNDVYIYNNGDGNDTISAGNQYSASFGSIQFGKYIASSRVTIQPIWVQSSLITGGFYELTDDIKIVIAPSSPNASDGGSILLRNYGEYLSSYGMNNTSSYPIIFSDGTKWSQSDIISKLTHITGTDQNDTLFGSVLKDTISGGLGNDYIMSTVGSDVYIYNSGDGNDTISGDNADFYVPILGTIQFGKDIASSRVTIQPVWGQSGLLYWDQYTLTTDDVVIVIAPSSPNALDGGSILLQLYAETLSIHGISNKSGYQISFADGTKWSTSDITWKLTHITGTDQNDTLFGTILNDTITGGRGDDFLYGGQGSDVFVFHQGDGSDTVVDFDAYYYDRDIIQLDPSLVSSWTDLLSKSSQSGANVVIAPNATDKIVLNNVSLSTLTEDNFRFQA